MRYVLLFFLFISPLFAHDYEHPELTPWFKELHSRGANGIGMQACCDGSEAVHVAVDDWRTRAGHYQVFLDDAWQDVPDEALVEGPNKEGEPLIWTYTVSGMGLKVHHVIRCFMPGAGL